MFKVIDRPLRPVPPKDSWHAVLTPVWRYHRTGGTKGPLLATVQKRLVWPLHCDGLNVQGQRPLLYGRPAELADALASIAPRRRRLTVWLGKGWEDLVGGGLGELLDRGDYRYKWATLDGARVILAGHLRGRRTDVTSLAAWTGGSWDAWAPEALELLALGEPQAGDEAEGALPHHWGRDVQVAVGTVLLVIKGACVLGLGRPQLSIGAQSRIWWRAWGGPVARSMPPAGTKTKDGKRPKPEKMCLPCPVRPTSAAKHEGHCCHGLVREQYAKGHVGGPITVIDMAMAYLVGVLANKLPSVFHETWKKPPAAKLRAWMVDQTGCALVRLAGTAKPYPVAGGPKPSRATGSFWAWLCGSELMHALQEGTVAEVHTAHLWWGMVWPKRAVMQLINLREVLKDNGLGCLAPFWRGLYAARVGAWHQRRYAWEDVDLESQLGRWATWTRLGAQPGEVESWRVVAGRVQRRRYVGEPPHALPLAYACVTAQIRCMMDEVFSYLPKGSVLATVCDALWATETGRKAFDEMCEIRTGEPPVYRPKDRYDDAWLDGQGGAVVLKDDHYFPLLPGVPHGVCLEADGKARWQRPVPWTDGTGVGSGTDRPRRVASWDGGRLVTANSGPLVPVCPWPRLHVTDLPEALLLPYRPDREAEIEEGGGHDS